MPPVWRRDPPHRRHSPALDATPATIDAAPTVLDFAIVVSFECCMQRNLFFFKKIKPKNSPWILKNSLMNSREFTWTLENSNWEFKWTLESSSELSRVHIWILWEFNWTLESSYLNSLRIQLNSREFTQEFIFEFSENSNEFSRIHFKEFSAWTLSLTPILENWFSILLV